MDRYRTRNEVEPYDALVGDRKYRFDLRPSARLQIRLAEFAGEKIGAQHVPLILEMLRGMTSTPEDVDDLLDELDVAELARLMYAAQKALMAVPTTARSDSSDGPSATTSATGSSDAESTPAISTG